MWNPPRHLLVPALALLVLAGCGSDSGSSDTTAATTVGASTTAATTLAPTTAGPPTTVPPAPATEQPSTGDAVEIIVNVDDPAQVGQSFPVTLGQTVILRLLSDTDQEYHVHGYDITTPTAAGVEATIEFTADQPGTFEVESHTSDAVLLTLQVQ